MTKARRKKPAALNDQPEVVQIKQQRRHLKPKSENQAKYLDSITHNRITLCMGPAGSGKTSLSVGKACNMLCNNEIQKIIITRPTIDNGKELGALPGTPNEKMHPYLIPVLDEMILYIGPQKVKELRESNNIEICPLQYMRGRNFHDTFMILDEAQNATYKQIKMFITRIGTNSKAVLNGDPAQSDLPRSYRNGFVRCMSQLTDLQGVGICELQAIDIVRDPIIAKVLERLVDEE